MAKYYHISQDLTLSPGDVFDNTKWDQSWYFANKFNCGTSQIQDEIVTKVVDSLRVQLNPNISPDQVEPGLTIVQNILLDGKKRGELLKEFLFESVRMSKFPSLPSRFKCAFLTDISVNPEDICKKYGFTSHLRSFYVLEDFGQNSNFKADPNHLNCNLAKPNEILEIAEKYWRGVRSPNGQIQEVLAIGIYKVVEKLEWPSK